MEVVVQFGKPQLWWSSWAKLSSAKRTTTQSKDRAWPNPVAPIQGVLPAPIESTVGTPFCAHLRTCPQGSFDYRRTEGWSGASTGFSNCTTTSHGLFLHSEPCCV